MKNIKIIYFFFVLSFLFFIFMIFQISNEFNVLKKENYENKIIDLKDYIDESFEFSFESIELLQKSILNNLKNICGNIKVPVNYNQLKNIPFNKKTTWISIINNSGKIIYVYNAKKKDYLSKFKTDLRKKLLSSILSKKKKSLALGFNQKKLLIKDKLAFIKRIGGDTVAIIHFKDKQMLEFRKKIGVGKILKNIIKFSDIKWIVLEINDKIFAGANVPENLEKIEMKYLNKLDNNEFIITKNFEVLFDLVVKDKHYGIIRFKLNSSEYKYRSRKHMKLILIFIGIVIFTFFLILKIYFLEKTNKVMIKQIEETKKEKVINNLVAHTAHQFRNPLNAIMLGIQRLTKKITDESLLNILSKIFQQSNRLNNIIEQVLKVGKPPEIYKKNIDFSNLIKDIVDAEKIVSQKYNVLIETDIKQNVFCCVDENSIKEAIGAIINNAIQASKKNQKIYVKLETKNNFIYVIIEDSGVGIKPGFENKIFDLYETDKSGGTGLGLPLALRIAKIHKGNLIYKKNKSNGATFIFSLKYDKK